MKVEIKKGVSQKTGREYEYLNLILNSGYEQKVFLKPAELQLIKMDLESSKENYKFK